MIKSFSDEILKLSDLFNNERKQREDNQNKMIKILQEMDMHLSHELNNER